MRGNTQRTLPRNLKLGMHVILSYFFLCHRRASNAAVRVVGVWIAREFSRRGLYVSLASSRPRRLPAGVGVANKVLASPTDVAPISKQSRTASTPAQRCLSGLYCLLCYGRQVGKTLSFSLNKPAVDGDVVRPFGQVGHFIR